MPAYTLTNNYSATGEGITYWLMYMVAASSEEVLAEFIKREPYFWRGAEVWDGFDLECREANLLLSEKCRSMFEVGGGNLFYLASVHVNYS